MIHTRYRDIKPYVTKDTTLIRELLHPSVHGQSKASFAEATLKPGAKSELHRHLNTEEIYHFTQGSGLMRLDSKVFEVKPKDTVFIPKGAAHQVENTSAQDMHILCICVPPYSHEDTQL